MKNKSPYKTQVHGIDAITDRDDESPMPHEVDDAMDTLARAESIKADPKMMGHVHEASGKKIRSLKSLKALARKKSADKPF